MAHPLQRDVLLAHDLVAKGAARLINGPAARWMLNQPAKVRRAYVEQVIDRDGETEVLRQAWMLRQPDAICESFIAEVLRRGPKPPDRQILWMLGQPFEVRQSYVNDVLL